MNRRHALSAALRRLYLRPDRPAPWTQDGNLPWNDPAFSARMLREHLDDSHSAASRTGRERALQLEWLWERLALAPGMAVLDFTCGPGLYAVPLAERGCAVTGVDFSPASIAHARGLAAASNVTGAAERCTFIESDVRAVELPPAAFDAALFLYGQLAVFPRAQAAALLAKIAAALRPGARLAVELLDCAAIDRTPHSSWWFTDDTGLWGDAPFLHLGERFWDEEMKMSLERFYTIHLATGRMDEVHLCDQAYTVEEARALLADAGFAAVDVHPAWDGLALHAPHEWIVYVARKG
jgi:SAM-dependent methyltransferase